ncbi:hypothetical protein A2U01_0016427, partial [Trifolium medium]|nr:hypothetical protein [Trifolium medium]
NIAMEKRETEEKIKLASENMIMEKREIEAKIKLASEAKINMVM